MNVGLFTDTYYPQINGVSTSVMMLKNNLEKLGHSVYVFTTTDPNAPTTETNVYRLPSISFASVGRISLFYQQRIAKKIKSLHLDLIHTQTEFSIGIFGRIMAKKLSIPIVHTMHTLYEQYIHYVIKNDKIAAGTKPLVRWLSRNFYNKVDSLVVPTEKVATLLREYGVQNKMNVIPTGVEVADFAPKRFTRIQLEQLKIKYGLKQSDKVLLYVGRIAQEKNIAELFKNLKTYLPHHPNIKLLLVGDGPYKKSYQKLAHLLGIGSQVIFAGAISRDEIKLYYQLGDVFVSASQSETQGLTFIEALAAGLPLIAKKDSCLDGVLFDQVNGFVFNDRISFLSILESALTDDLQMRRMSAEATHSVVTFSAINFAQRMELLYGETLRQSLYTKGKLLAHV